MKLNIVRRVVGVGYAAAEQRRLSLEVVEVLAERKAKYVAPEPNIKTGWLSRYARMVTSANLGAVLK